MVSKDVMAMEMLPINNQSGQSYGYTLYATKISKDAKKVLIYDARDRVTVCIFSPDLAMPFSVFF